MMLPPRRHNILDVLADQMGQGMGGGLRATPGAGLDPALQAYLDKFGALPGQALPMPPGLPDAVQRSIQNEPQYSEREVIPGGRGFTYWPGVQDFAPDRAQQQMGGHEREQLNYELGMAKQFPNYGFALGEGEIAVPTDTERLRYSRPFNLGLGNMGALY